MSLLDMKLSWTEPWNREMIRRRIRDVSLSMPSVRKISIWGGVLPLVSMIAVRWILPESCEVLTWAVIVLVTMCCVSYAFVPYLLVIFPMCVHLSEKGVILQGGGAGSFFPRGRISSLSFEDRDGLHLLVIRYETKCGEDAERTALTSAKCSDDDVRKFLFDVGMAHLWKSA